MNNLAYVTETREVVRPSRVVYKTTAVGPSTFANFANYINEDLEPRKYVPFCPSLLCACIRRGLNG